MSYNVFMEETYVYSPESRVRMNARVSKSCETLNEVMFYIGESSRKIHREYNVIREWNEKKGESVVHKILFSRKRGHGRLLQKFVVNEKKKIVYNDSLI